MPPSALLRFWVIRVLPPPIFHERLRILLYVQTFGFSHRFKLATIWGVFPFGHSLPPEGGAFELGPALIWGCPSFLGGGLCYFPHPS